MNWIKIKKSNKQIKPSKWMEIDQCVWQHFNAINRNYVDFINGHITSSNWRKSSDKKGAWHVLWVSGTVQTNKKNRNAWIMEVINTQICRQHLYWHSQTFRFNSINSVSTSMQRDAPTKTERFPCIVPFWRINDVRGIRTCQFVWYKLNFMYFIVRYKCVINTLINVLLINLLPLFVRWPLRIFMLDKYQWQWAHANRF